MNKNPNRAISATVDRFENGLVVVNFGNCGELIIPRRNLPDDLKEGDVLQVEIITDQMATNRKKHLAKAILKEILK